ncbi:MAG: FadR/GntR family transcriptional regulator [Actinomycetota bacterium]
MDTTESSRFVAEVKARILSGALPDGVRLESERDLAVRYGLSRTTIRAGLQSLEASGLIRRKIGRNGGSFVAVPTEAAVSDSLQLVIGAGGVSESDLMETRLAIEPMCAELAARRMSKSELAALSATQSEMASALKLIGKPADRRRLLAANARFHLQVAEGSGNAALAAILRGLIGPIEALTDAPEVIDHAQLRELIRAHEAIYSALRAGDSERAGRVMRKHLLAHIRLAGGS